MNVREKAEDGALKGGGCLGGISHHTVLACEPSYKYTVFSPILNWHKGLSRQNKIIDE